MEMTKPIEVEVAHHELEPGLEAARMLARAVAVVSQAAKVLRLKLLQDVDVRVHPHVLVARVARQDPEDEPRIAVEERIPGAARIAVQPAAEGMAFNGSREPVQVKSPPRIAALPCHPGQGPLPQTHHPTPV